MSDKTDGVLAVFDADIERQRIGVAAGRCDPDAMAEFEDARNAVAELLAADEEYDAANVARFDVNIRPMERSTRWEAAQIRRAAAIRAMRGDAT